MNLGRVYLPADQQPGDVYGGRIAIAEAPLPHLDPAPRGELRLSGRYARVRQAGEIMEPDGTADGWRAVSIGDARPDSHGDFIFDPGRGGGRIDKRPHDSDAFRLRYTQAAHFGEVNVYFHLDRIGTYLASLLTELGAPPLPPVVALVNAHHAATEHGGVRDGVYRNGHWRAFQGGHYRLPSRKYDIAEYAPLSPDGEIHFGPGWRITRFGALVAVTGRSYRANAAHNAGIIYHEYGHHITRHTADFRANALRPGDRQDNRKTAMDEGVSDYWAATMLDTPHIWHWHRRHDDQEIHPRSLASARIMADFDSRHGADPHMNGAIWAATLWDLRERMGALDAAGARKTDLLLLKSLLLLGQRQVDGDVKATRRLRRTFTAGLTALLQADCQVYGSAHERLIRETFARRGMAPEDTAATTDTEAREAVSYTRGPGDQSASARLAPALLRAPASEVPPSRDILSADQLEELFAREDEPPYSVIASGDIMLGGRSRRPIEEHGPDYPFAAVRPLLQRSPLVFGNLEGPFARRADKVDRTYSYRVRPSLASALTRAGISVVTLANNHLLDCGREGVIETLDILEASGVAPLGAGCNEQCAHMPVIRQSGPWRIGLLGYYWNRRCAATAESPGAATDTHAELEADIGALRPHVDRIVVTFHWGIPYEREPLEADRAKARFAIDCGADAVIGHHPHILQPIEVYRERPIVYSVGNFAFGSGNSRAEGLLVGLRFEPADIIVDLYPLYVKNRDPRVNYQPKLLSGGSASAILTRLAETSGSAASERLRVDGWSGRLRIVTI